MLISKGSMASRYFEETFRAFPAFEASSSRRSLGSVREIYSPRNKEDYPRAVDEDDLGASVLTVSSIQGISAEDGIHILDDETSVFDSGRCHTVLYDPSESVQYFDDEDLFGRLYPDFDYFKQGSDHGEELEEESLAEDMIFESGWDSDDTVTNARLMLRDRHLQVMQRDIGPEEHVDEERIAEDSIAQYFDADDLFEQEEVEMFVYGQSDDEFRWYSEDY